MEKRYTDEQLKYYFNLAVSMADLSRKLGLKRGNRTLIKNLERLGLDDKLIKTWSHDQRPYTIEELKEAAKISLSIGQLMDKLGVRRAGGNYGTIKKRIKDFNIDVSHFTGQSWNKGKRSKTDDYLSWSTLRKMVLEKKENKCEICYLTNWLDKPITFEIHHKDGNRENNKEENLQLLCPNCHSQIHNHKGRNRKSRLRNGRKELLEEKQKFI